MKTVEKTETCRVCGADSKYVFSGRILDKYDISYFLCDHCGFLQTEEPYWLLEVYGETLPLADSGLMRRNLLFADKIEKIIRNNFDSGADFLDYGGGYGIFTRLMRDRDLNFFHHDSFSKNLFGYEATSGQKFELVTLIEVWEHLKHPLAELEEIIKKFPADSILFTTHMYPENMEMAKHWHYLSQETGQHIGFLSPKTLAYMAKKLGMQYYSTGLPLSLHLLTKKKLDDPLSDSFFSQILQKAIRVLKRLEIRL